MNVNIIIMDPQVAREKLAAYKSQLHRRADAEYEAAVVAYQAIADGYDLLNLTEVMQAAGVGLDKRPKLAIARADRKQVMVSRDVWSGNSHLEFSTSSRGYRSRGSMLVRVGFPLEQIKETPTGYALIPMVPADVRPNVDLAKCFVLWEVDRWSNRRLGTQPDRDPFLLRHVIGDLYAVLAEWELTELERAIMSGRRDA